MALANADLSLKDARELGQAARIIDMAQQGTVDQKELANSAVRFLAANYRLERKRPQGSPEMAVRLRVQLADTARRCRNNTQVYWKCRAAERISAASLGRNRILRDRRHDSSEPDVREIEGA
jgi:hypothetical protein